MGFRILNKKKNANNKIGFQKISRLNGSGLFLGIKVLVVAVLIIKLVGPFLLFF